MPIWLQMLRPQLPTLGRFCFRVADGDPSRTYDPGGLQPRDAVHPRRVFSKFPGDGFQRDGKANQRETYAYALNMVDDGTIYGQGTVVPRAKSAIDVGTRCVRVEEPQRCFSDVTQHDNGTGEEPGSTEAERTVIDYASQLEWQEGFGGGGPRWVGSTTWSVSGTTWGPVKIFPNATMETHVATCSTAARTGASPPSGSSRL